jgi:hypothetical protein
MNGRDDEIDDAIAVAARCERGETMPTSSSVTLDVFLCER